MHLLITSGPGGRLEWGCANPLPPPGLLADPAPTSWRCVALGRHQRMRLVRFIASSRLALVWRREGWHQGHLDHGSRPQHLLAKPRVSLLAVQGGGPCCGCCWRTTMLTCARLLGSPFDARASRYRSAIDGEHALSTWRAEPPDVILLDVRMPKMDGFQVLSTIRRNSHIPIIMLTACTSEDEVLRGLKLGADDYVVKPYSPRQLAARIRAVCRRAQISAAHAETNFEAAGIVLDLESHQRREAPSRCA